MALLRVRYAWFELFYSDGYLFWGHFIIVYGNWNGKMEAAKPADKFCDKYYNYMAKRARNVVHLLNIGNTFTYAHIYMESLNSLIASSTIPLHLIVRLE